MNISKAYIKSVRENDQERVAIALLNNMPDNLTQEQVQPYLYSMFKTNDLELHKPMVNKGSKPVMWTVSELYAGLEKYFLFYNTERLHQSLNYKTPQVIHFA